MGNLHRDTLSPPWILVLADDLTGALEVGAKFAGYGLKTSVTTDGRISSRPQCDVLVIDTETRHVAESRAYEIVHRVALEGKRFGPGLIYKKTDSTLRGNIAAEFRALKAAFQGRSLVYAPAYAEMGRTVRGGKLYVWGTLLHETEFAKDPLNPIRESDIGAMLKDENVVVLDGEWDHDLTEAVRLVMATRPAPLAAGPAALAGALAEFLGVNAQVQKELPRLPRCLVVNGSMHPASLGQMILADSCGCFERWTCFTDEPVGIETGLDRAKWVGERVRRILKTSEFDGLVVFGGDTAFAIHAAVGAPEFAPCGEVVPGVPISQCGGLFWITKAGGFGPPDTLCQIQKLLT